MSDFLPAKANPRDIRVDPEASALRIKVNLGFAIALGILCVIGGMAFWSIERFAQAAEERRNSSDLRIELSHLLAELTTAETGQRGYLLTGNEAYLEPFTSSSADVDQRFIALRRATRSDSHAQERLRLLEPLIQQKLAVMRKTIDFHRQQRIPAALAVVNSGEGKRLMDSIRSVVASIDAEATKRRDRWDAQVSATTRVALLTIGGVSGLAVLLVFAAGLLINRGILKRAQGVAALRDSESRLFQVLEALPVAVFVADAEGKPYYANQASGEILGKGILPIGASDIAEVYQAYRAGSNELYPTEGLPVIRALAGERAHVTDLEIHQPGRVIPLDCWSAPVRDAGGKVVWAIAVFNDITVRKRSEDELSRAKAAAEAANYAKSDFLAKMSHELRTPLNSIIGFSEMMQDESAGPLNDKQRRYVGNVLTSGRNLLQLINDILDLSKVEAGHMELALAPFDVGLAFSEVQTIVGALLAKKNLGLDVEVETGLLPLRADQSKVKQVLYNLLSNAIKFTPEGGRIRLSARHAVEINAREGGNWIEFSVADTGIGLRQDDLERIFGEFEQVDSSYTRNQEGTGLGLALSRKLVELHGGWIWVESELGKGSIFRFIIPADPPTVGTETGVPVPDQAHAAEEAPLILVVEDDAQTRDLIDQHLRQAGYRVAHASDGTQAVALARELRPDGITLDILLPDRDGLDVLAQLKGDTATRAIPVVVVSITDQQDLGNSLGAADWIVKPASRDEFVRRLRRALGGVMGDAATPAPKVLVVDDERVSLELLTDLLARQGFHILVAHSGREGIDLARAERPDLIVLDLLMPEMSGFDVVRELRASPETRDVPILIFTVKDLTPEERERLRGQVQGVVRKGASMDLLRELARLRTDQQKAV